MLTASWSTPLTSAHLRIGISRGVPRGQAAGFRMCRKLAPGQWFNSVEPAEYARLYREEILSRLDPEAVAAELRKLAWERIPVLVCFEKPGRGAWCHRAMAAQWLANGIGEPVPELGFEHLPQDQHPLLPLELDLPG